MAYDPESDLENTPDSVFCAHGAGYPVKWYKVPEFMHPRLRLARRRGVKHVDRLPTPDCAKFRVSAVFF